jgi:hypothetical protein
LPVDRINLEVRIQTICSRRTARTSTPANRSRKGSAMKKANRIEIAKEIISRLKLEMNKPRLTESVRNGQSGATAMAAQWPGALRIEEKS